MLSPADLDLIRRDPALPGLRRLLDADALGELLRAEVPALEFEQVEINYVRYKPGTNCLAGFVVQSRHGAFHGYARSLRLSAVDKLEKEKERPAIPGALGPHRLVIARLGIAISTAANDRKLRSLGRLSQNPAGLLGNALPANPEFRRATLQPLNYKPARRFVGKLVSDEGSAAALKIYCAGEFEKARQAAQRLASVSGVTTLLGHSSRHRILVFGWVEGAPLNQLLTDSRAMTAAGRALGRFHQWRITGLPARTGLSVIRELAEVSRGLANLLPPLRSRARLLARRLADSINDDGNASATLHGDFYAHQVLMQENGEILLLDCDEAATGNPRHDIGNFLAHVERRVLIGDLTSAQGEAARAAFLGGYGGPANLASCRPFIGAALFRLAHEPFRRREPDWPQRIEQILQRAESFVEATPKRPHLLDAKIPFLAAALDSQQAAAALRAALGTPRIELRGVRLVRHKPGRRALIEYSLAKESAALDLLGKAHAKRTAKSSYEVQSSLWQSAFNPSRADGLYVPEPMGTIPKWNMWLQRKVSGESATKLLWKRHGAALARRIAELAYKLHRTSVPAKRRPHTLADEVRILHERLALVAQARPKLATRLHRLLGAVDEFASTIPPPRICGIHRDFYADQVIVDGDCLYLLDFDLYCEGDPAIDLGNFAAHLREEALRVLGAAGALCEQEQAMVDRYCELASDDISLRARIHAFTLLTLVRHIHISMRIPDRAHLAETILDLCERARLEEPQLAAAKN